MLSREGEYWVCGYGYYGLGYYYGMANRYHRHCHLGRRRRCLLLRWLVANICICDGVNGLTSTCLPKAAEKGAIKS